MSEGEANNHQQQPLQSLKQHQQLDVPQPPGKKRPSYALDRSSKQKANSHANKKWVRLATVLAYVVAVSMAAFGLAIYYSFVWKPGNFDSKNQHIAGNSTTESTPL